MTEKRDIPGFPGYQVTADGRVWSTKRGGRWLKPGLATNGHLIVSLQMGGKGHTRHVHALVLLAFRGARPEGAVTRHLNGDPLDNRLENLAYGTQSENMLDKVAHGTDHNVAKTHCPKGHSYEGENLYMQGRSRACKSCARQRVRDWRARQGS